MNSELLKVVVQAKALVEKELKALPRSESAPARLLPPPEPLEASAPPLPPPAAASPYPAGPQPATPYAPDLAAFELQISACQRCGLGKARTRFVFGEGNPKSDLVFVGEAPGAEEDRLGRPLLGEAGKLFDKIIAAMGRRRQDVYICNLLKCRPPLNRDPTREEAAECRPFLEHQLGLLNPRIICTLGDFAMRSLLGIEEDLSQVHGKEFAWEKTKVVPTYHPSALLRDADLKKPVWEDIKGIMALLR